MIEYSSFCRRMSLQAATVKAVIVVLFFMGTAGVV